MSNLSEQVDTDELQKLFDQTLNDTTSVQNTPVASTEAPKPEQPEKPSETPEVNTPAVEDKPTPAATENQWLAALPEEAKQHFESLERERERLLNNWKIEQGRTAKALRDQREAQQRLEQAKQQREAVPVAAKENERVKELLDALEESDAPMAETLRAIMDDVLSKAKAQQDTQLGQVVDTHIAPIQQANVEAYKNEQRSVLDRECKNWRDVMQSPDFIEYLKHQPKFMQDAYYSDHAGDVLFMLRTYSNDVFGPSASAAPAEAAKGGDPSEAQKIEQRRNEKLQKSVVPSSASTQQKVTQLSEEQELQKLFDKAIKGEI